MSEARLAPEKAAAARAGQQGVRGGRTLRRALLAWLAAPLALLWVASGVVDYDIGKRFVNLAYDRALLEAALDIGRQVKVFDGRIYVDLPEVALQMLQTREYGRLYYLVTGPSGEFVSGEPDLPPPPDPRAARIRYYDDRYREQLVRAVALRVPVEPGSDRGTVLIQVAEPVTLRAHFARQLAIGMMLPQLLLIVLAGLAVWYGVGRGLGTLAHLQREIASRSHRDLSALPEEQAPLEVRPLIRAMNGLLARLSQAMAVQQRFVADAAHQLRTPIAGLKTQTELALRETGSAGGGEPLRQLHAATEQLGRLVHQLLALARAEPGMGQPRATARLDFAQLAREATGEWVPRALARGVDLGFDGAPGPLTVEGDAFLLREMLNNLLDNAVRYGRTAGQVTVSVAAQGPEALLVVEDDGPGIPEAEHERVFERFYRVLGTRAEGCGLGLAIVREIARGHGGEATLTAGAGGQGTRVLVRLPRAA